MTVNIRPYDRIKDYDKVGDFLIKSFVTGYRSGNWLQPRWEYMHFHPNLNESQLSKIGIFEDSGNIVGVVNYEDEPGDAYFHVHSDYSYLKPEMLQYAEQSLYRKLDNGQGYLRAFINDFDMEFESIARFRGYKKDENYPEFRAMSEFVIINPFPEINLPEGFKLKSLQDDNDLSKVNKVLWRGFDHEGEVPEDLSGRKKMQSAPNFRKDLTIVVEAPDGDFVSYCGMWFDPVNRISYVEPVATDPNYRRMGLGKAAVLEGIRRCGQLGAAVSYVGSGQPFYFGIGFRKIFSTYPWVKRFDCI